MKKLLNIFLVLVFVLSLVPLTASAAPVLQTACEEDVVVQADDWLSKLADKFYGDVLAFPAIAEATNQQNAVDDSYARIDDPDVIEPGWKLCIPSGADAAALLGGEGAAVAAATNTGEPGAPAELSSVSYGNFNPNYASNLLTELSDHFGWLQEGGIEDQEVVFIDQSQIFPAIIGGSLQLASQDTDAVAAANLAGEELIMVSIYRDKEPWILTFREGIDINNLEGVQCSGGGAGSRNEFNAQEMIRRLGGDPDQVEWVPISGGSDARSNAFVEGLIDCVQHFDRHRAMVTEAGGVITYDDLEEVPQDGFVVDRAVAEQNPRTVVNYLKAFIQARDFFNDVNNKDEIIEIMRSREYEIPQEFVDQYERQMLIIGDDGYFDPAAMDTLIADAVRVGNLESSIDWHEFVDLSYLNQAYRELGRAGEIRDPDAAAQPAAAASGEPIVVGASLPLTGGFSVNGQKHKEGYELCVDLINQSGGLLGRPVEVIVSDNRSDTETALSQTERMINVDNVDVLFGTFSSRLTFPVSAIAQQNNMVYPIPAGGALRIYERGFDNLFYFQVAPAEFVGNSPIELLVERAGGDLPQTAAVVHADDFFANGIANGLIGGEVEVTEGQVIELPSLLADAGIELVYNEQWPEEGFADWITLANSIKNSGAEFLIGLTASPEETVQLTRALQTVGYQPKAVYLSQGTQAEYLEGVGDAANGVMIHAAWHPSAPWEGVLGGQPFSNQDFVAAYEAEFGAPPDEDVAIPFAVCQGMAQAIEGAGTTDNAAIIAWLNARSESDPVQTILGPFHWNEKGLPIGKSFLMTQWQDGELNFVYPLDEFEGVSDFIYPKPEW